MTTIASEMPGCHRLPTKEECWAAYHAAKLDAGELPIRAEFEAWWRGEAT